METDIVDEFDDICAKLNIDHYIKANAIQKFKEVTQNTILEGNPRDWFCCALWTSYNKSTIPTVGNSLAESNGVSFAKLLQVCNLSIFTFFEKIETWFKVSSVPNAMNQSMDHLKRRFNVSHLIYKEFSSLFAKIFSCNDANGDGDQPKTTKSRRKVKNIPFTSQKLFEMCWSLFVCVKSDYPDKSTDLVTSVNLLLCCLDLIFTNVVHENRRDLINSTFSGLPKNFFSTSWDESKSPPIDIIEKLCDRQSLEEVQRVKVMKFEPVMRKFNANHYFQGKMNEILGVDNFEFNFKKVNDLYETFILNCGQFDERVFLYHADSASKNFGRVLTADSSQSGPSTSNLMPQTPLSGQDFLNQPSNKLSPISSYKQNVQKLRALYNGNRGPTDSLKEILLVSCPETILDSLKNRLNKMEDIFCTKMIPNGQDRFQYAEALYYRLLESIINSEMKTHGRFDLFIDDDIFNQTLIVLCLEIVLFAFSLHKELTALLDCFKLEPFHFYKLIEVAIRNNKDFFTNDIIKHLKSVEEQCLDSLAWMSGSVLWEKIGEHKGKLPASHVVEVPLAQQLNENSQSPNDDQPSPKSLTLFFRKYYQLAHLRLKDLCKNLQFTNNTELLRKIWTLFEHAVTDHTELMKDRHLDQILMCCVYVLCKIRANENRHTFADIMKFYRNQPQSDSHIYRSVFLEYVKPDNDKTNDNKDQQGAGKKKFSDAAEPEVVSGRNTIYGTESRGDIILFYNKIFVPKMQSFAMNFSTNSTSQNNLLLSPLPNARPTISPRKIWPFHDVYVQPLTKQSCLSPSASTFTFTVEQSPSKDLKTINSLINNRKLKRFNIDSVSKYPPSKVTKDSSLQLLISDREDLSN